MFSRLLGVAAVSSVLVATAAGQAGAAAAGGWQVVPSANPQASQVTDSIFTGLSMNSATDGWAVGLFMDDHALENPLTEHWDGSSFTRVIAPEPAGQQALLLGVDQLSSTSAWAVGTSAQGVEGEVNVDNEPLIEHWNGERWSMVKGASLPADTVGSMDAIGGSGPRDLWAVGSDGSAPGAPVTTGGVLFEHFNGTWQRTPFPTQQTACDPGGDAGGCGLLPKAVTATSPDNAWVVGTIEEPNPTGNFIAHWDGKSWHVVHPPCLEGNQVIARCSGAVTADLNSLTGVTAISPTDIWASGAEGLIGQNVHVPYVLHWNGTRWSLVKTPDPNSNTGAAPGEGNELNGITAISSTDIWAVGLTEGGPIGAVMPVTEQFNGTTWKLVPSPAPGRSASGNTDDSLDGVASPAPGLVFAVGAREVPGQCCLRTLALKTTSG